MHRRGGTTRIKFLASKVARENGYAVRAYRGTSNANLRNVSRQGKLPLCLPFISDDISAEIRRSIVRAQLQDDVVLVNIPNSNIKRQLVRNRLYDRQCNTADCVICPYGREGDCEKTGVIYQIECRACNSTYIGETGRDLATRIKEHLAGKRRDMTTTPLGKHKIEEHNGNDFDVACTILGYEAEISSRKALESFWIFARKPRMNGRNECPSITNEFLPFVSECELQ